MESIFDQMTKYMFTYMSLCDIICSCQNPQQP